MRNPSKAIRLATAAFCIGACAAQPLGAAQPDPAKDYPNKPIRFIVPFVPGAGTDITGRAIAAKLTDRWGHQVVVDNRTGAAGAIGVEITAQAIPDGYTICLISASHTVNSATNPRLPYSAAKRSPAAPELPTIAEADVPGYEVDQWYGVVTSAKVPRAIVNKLSAGIAEGLKAPEVVQRFSAEGSTPVGSSPEQFGAHIKSEIAKWRKLVKDAGLALH